MHLIIVNNCIIRSASECELCQMNVSMIRWTELASCKCLDQCYTIWTLEVLKRKDNYNGSYTLNTMSSFVRQVIIDFLFIDIERLDSTWDLWGISDRTAIFWQRRKSIKKNVDYGLYALHENCTLERCGRMLGVSLIANDIINKSLDIEEGGLTRRGCLSLNWAMTILCKLYFFEVRCIDHSLFFLLLVLPISGQRSRQT